ncbi:MAG: sarcosine oxidase subunit gamma [Pseudomonadota bacterium]
MAEIFATNAFGAPEPREAVVGSVTLRERMDIALASVALRADAARPAPFGLTLPEPGFFAESESANAIWMAPGHWLIEGPGRAELDFAAEVESAAPGCSVTEQTDGWVILDLEGPEGDLEQLRERLVNLPAETLSPGKATRSLVHHMSVLLIRRSPDRLSVMGMRSMAGSLWHALHGTAERYAVRP